MGQVDFTDVSTEGVESSPVAEALAGLRANEARYFHNKYKHIFTTVPASEAPEPLGWVEEILKSERDIVFASRPLEISINDVDGIHWVHVFYESGLAVNVLYTVDDGGNRAVGFKLSEGMEVPEELSSFKFARQKSKLAGTIRGSFFVIKGGHPRETPVASPSRRSPAGQIVHLALPVASWWIAVIGVARLLFGMRVGDLFSHARRIRWRLLVMSLVVGLVGFGASAAIGVHVANNVVSLSAGVLRGEDLLGGQADVSASMIELGIQLAFAALICLWVVLLSRRERRGA